MSRHGTYDLKYGFIPDMDCPQSNPQTNADRIRSMTDEELAIWISALYSAQYHVKGDPRFWADWLRQESEA